MIDDPPTEEERAEAEALARALDGGEARPPDDALEVAALLRYVRASHRAGDQADAQRLGRARAAAQLAKPLPLRHAGRRLGKALLATSLAAAALVLAYLPQNSAPHAPSAEAPSQAPAAAPPAQRPALRALLEAQAQALAQRDAALAPLLQASAQQRRELWSELAQRYGGTR